MRGSARQLTRLARRIRRGSRSDVDDALVKNEDKAQEALGDLLLSFRDEIWSQTSYLRTLEQTLTRHLDSKPETEG